MLSEIERRYKAGESNAEIRRALNLTAGQIAGIVHRHKAEWGERPKNYVPPKVGRKPALEKLRLSPAVAEKPCDTLQVVRSVAELEKGRCNWPVGEVGAADFHFCGELTEENERWCTRHRALGTEKARPAPVRGRGLRGRLSSWQGS